MNVRGAAWIRHGPDRAELVTARCIGNRLAVALEIIVERRLGAIVPDVAPSMVHSGPLQTAVSGGVPALILQLAFFAAVGLAVARRWRREPAGRARLTGAAFLASGCAYFVQDLSGWPHVALGALVSVIAGLATSWMIA